MLYLSRATGVRRCSSEKVVLPLRADVSATQATRKCAESGKGLLKMIRRAASVAVMLHVRKEGRHAGTRKKEGWQEGKQADWRACLVKEGR